MPAVKRINVTSKRDCSKKRDGEGWRRIEMRKQRAVDLVRRISHDVLLRAITIVLFGLYLLFFCFLTFGTTYAAVWGNASIGVYPFDSRIVAPNGRVYTPIGRLGFDLNIGNDSIYVFDENVLLLQKATPGVTNADQGNFDFSKREYDFKVGLAARPFADKHIEFRFWGTALNNLNRGGSATVPQNYNDGTAGEGRYYFSGKRLWGYLSGGYYLTGTLVEPNGQPFRPRIFGGANLNYNLLEVPQKLYAFTDITVINHFGHFEGGLAYRPLRNLPDTEVRFSGSKYLDLYGKSTVNTAFLLEIRHYFNTAKSSNIQRDDAHIQSEPISKATTVHTPSNKLAATDVWFDLRMIHVSLLDGREIGVPLTWFPKLWNAQDGQRKSWHLTADRTAIYWEKLDETISVAELLKG
jgi:hypothetical protein